MENDNIHKFFSINKLAQFSNTTRSTLLHYESVGLLVPAFVDIHKRRYYSYEQIGFINLIRMLQMLGMSLKEIAECIQERTSKDMLDILKNQLMAVNKIIAEQVEVQKLILKLQNDIESAIKINEDEIGLHWEEKKNIFLGPQIYHSRGKTKGTDFEALIKFYEYCDKNAPNINLSLNYSPWAFFSKERIKRNDWVYPDKYYLYTPNGHDEKPAGLYVTGYTRGHYGYPQNDELYKRLIKYILENNLEIAGGAYEEYPLNEKSVKTPTNYLIRVSILVKRKESRLDKL